jgi:hypothetical protein
MLALLLYYCETLLGEGKKRAKLEPTEPDQEQYASILIFGGD